MSSPFLIAVEGLPRAGKSSFIQSLSHELRKHGSLAKIVKWNAVPTIRRTVATLESYGGLTPLRYAVLQWVAFVVTYNKCIAPAIEQGGVVILDRYVYTAYTRDMLNGCPTELTRALYTKAQLPDWLLYVESDPALCCRRMQGDKAKPLFHLCDQLKHPEDYLRALSGSYEHVLADPQLICDTSVIRVGQDKPITEIVTQLSPSHAYA